MLFPTKGSESRLGRPKHTATATEPSAVLLVLSALQSLKSLRSAAYSAWSRPSSSNHSPCDSALVSDKQSGKPNGRTANASRSDSAQLGSHSILLGKGTGMVAPATTRSRVVLATTLLFSAKFFYWILSRGIYPFSDQFSASMNVSRTAFFNALSIGELSGVLAVFFRKRAAGTCSRMSLGRFAWSPM